MSKVEISKINISVGGKDIPLSLEEAKELQQILNDTFGKKELVYPSSPIIIERPIYPRPWRYWEVTWQRDSGSGAYSYSLTNSARISSQ